jgi:site-specific DNA-cytosine methylase
MTTKSLTSIDLFSDIGCHAEGFLRAGIQTLALCEINEYRRAVLAQRFPGVPIHDDVRSYRGETADIVFGGPPCQGTSVAAAVHGYRDGNTLWPEMRRIGTNAEWIVVEQPPGNAAWEAQVVDDLCRDGRHVARIEFAACDIGAPYIRRRVYLVACSSLPRLEIAWSAVPRAIDSVKRAANARGDWDPNKLRALRVDARSAGEMDRGSYANSVRKERIEALGDSNPPHMAEVIGRAILQASH